MPRATRQRVFKVERFADRWRVVNSVTDEQIEVHDHHVRAKAQADNLEEAAIIAERRSKLSDRDRARDYLDREIARPAPTFATYDPEWIRGYQEHVRRWMDCAPEGAVFLLAPLCGWDGSPFTTRERQGPQDTAVNPRIRAIRLRKGFDPISGRGVSPEAKALLESQGRRSLNERPTKKVRATVVAK